MRVTIQRGKYHFGLVSIPYGYGAAKALSDRHCRIQQVEVDFSVEERRAKLLLESFD